MLATLFKKPGRFTGGIKLPERKSLSNGDELRIAPVPENLIHPLGQHIGKAAKPCVAVGERVLRGQTIAVGDGLISADVHAASSGTVTAIEPRPIAHSSGLLAPCIAVDCDGVDESAEPQPHGADYLALSGDELRSRVRAAGIVGMGGAAFPAAVKLNSRGRAIDTLILNGAECESYITCDDMLARTRADDIIRSVPIFRHILGVPNLPVIIALEDHMQQAIAALQTALEQSGLRRVEVRAVPSIYPEGGEKQLIQTLTGLEVPTGGLPLDIGLVCQNIGTAAAIYRGIVHGEPLTSRIVTVTGEAIQQPGNYEVRLGSTVADIVAAAGGYKGGKPARLIMGGAMMGFALKTDDVPIIKGSNCVLAATSEEVRPGDSVMPCIRCGECAEVCPASLLPQQLYWHTRGNEFDKAKKLNLFDCIECGACAQACPSHIPLVQYYRYGKAEIWAEEREKAKSDAARERHEFRLERIEREEQEKIARQKQRQAALAATKKPNAVADSNAADPVKAALAKAAAAKAKASDAGGALSAIDKAKAKAKQRQAEAAGETPAAAPAVSAAAAAIANARAKAKAAAEAETVDSNSAAETPAQAAIRKAREASAKAKGAPSAEATLTPAQQAIAAAKQKARDAAKNATQAPVPAAETPAPDKKTPAQLAIEKARAAAKAKESEASTTEPSSPSEPAAEPSAPELQKAAPKKKALSAAELAILKAKAAAKKAEKEQSQTGAKPAAAKSPALLAIERAKAAAKAAQADNQGNGE